MVILSAVEHEVRLGRTESSTIGNACG